MELAHPHPTQHMRPSREPITVSLTCNYHHDTTIGEEGSIPLSNQFKSQVKESIKSLKNYDTIIINLKFHSTTPKQVPPNQQGTEATTIQQESKDETPDPKTIVDARQLESILSTVYTLVEWEKAASDELMMLQVDVLIAGFSQITRSHDHSQQIFKNLALGGTFDHLHSGHKILLTIACWLTTHTLIVGITDDELLKNKKYSEILEGVNERKEGVKSFIERVGPLGMNLELPILKDIYGPTATDPAIDGLIVTQETVSGANSIDQIRMTNHLKPLRRYVIDVISPSESLRNQGSSDLKDLKISSTRIRAWLHDHQLIYSPPSLQFM